MGMYIIYKVDAQTHKITETYETDILPIDDPHGHYMLWSPKGSAAMFRIGDNEHDVSDWYTV